MTGTTIALFRDPWAGLEDAPASPRRPLLLWRKAMWFKANPRSAEYMRARVAEVLPEAQFVDVAAEPRWASALAGADEVMLVYPDAIGIGFLGLERAVVGRVPRRAIRVLNGRRRVFPLDAKTHRRLVLHRVLERSMIIECVLGAIVLTATPVLFCVDLARGRR